jgi:hypothetical protein
MQQNERSKQAFAFSEMYSMIIARGIDGDFIELKKIIISVYSDIITPQIK